MMLCMAQIHVAFPEMPVRRPPSDAIPTTNPLRRATQVNGCSLSVKLNFKT